MSITEYNEERHMKMLRMESIEQGREQGAYNNKIEMAMNLLVDGTFNHEKIANLTGLPIEKVEELAKLMV